MKKKPKEYMVVFICSTCGMDSGFREGDPVTCYYCDVPTEMKQISRERITPELMKNRLKTLADRLFNSLLLAHHSLSEEEKTDLFSEETDVEKEMLLLLEQADKFRKGVEEINAGKE